MILKGSQIPLGIGIQSLVQQLRNDTALDLQGSGCNVHHVVQSCVKLVLIGRQIGDSGHIDGDNAHASGALAGTEESSGLLAQFPQIQTQSAAHTADITGLHVRIDIIGKIRCTVFCGHLE